MTSVALGADASSSAGSRGEKIYAKHCSVCHGDGGDGSSWARNGLNPPPRNFTQAKLDRQRMLQSVTHGRPGTAMMPFKSRLSAEEIAAVVDYIRDKFMSAKASPVKPAFDLARVDMQANFADGLRGDFKKGKAFYQKYCSECHGLKGDGLGPRSSFISPKPRNFLSAASRAILNRPALFTRIAKGKVGTVMPAWQTVLSPQQIANVAEYVYQAFIRSNQAPLSSKKHSSKSGQEIYRQHCYFCHGYRGDAATLAAQFLQPPPVDFTRLNAKAVSRESMLQSVNRGKPGSAMQAYATRLSNKEIADVVDYIRLEIMSGKPVRYGYHNADNGWLDHDRYQQAYAFASGDLPLDTPTAWLSPQQQAGKQLYMQTCISCHDKARVMDSGPVWTTQSVSYPRQAAETPPPHVDAISGASPYAKHEIPKKLPQLSPQEQQGEKLFQENCQFCHAADGSGKNWIGSFLQPRPRNLNESELWAMGKQRLKVLILNGVSGTSMPAWQSILSESQIDAVIAYIGRLAGSELK